VPRRRHAVEIDAPPEAVFDAFHDYAIRLEWDSMLREARLLGGATRAGVGVRSLCVGTWQGAFMAVETEYVSFARGRLAAVKLTNRPPFFRQFAATLRHEPSGAGGSRTTYIYSFEARPSFLRPVLDPVMTILLDREVRRRLARLRAYLERGRGSAALRR
jgi:uncharacterized protein YndB with AHSA1/START domain